ncbi:YigZ family protein [Thalassotalea eurytherma]|uniref:IMPACT family member n=1 Tax=Thalassotalea eurytherma TaxID=1144278 RepID=A0ABQ6H179_9GAMM|nr:YigZ family protein [Thalassotalea eurytherma]GLX80567.1 IMPACT family member [Thalassotalea eurytherma]
MANKPYQVAINDVVEETIVNRSRFICFLFPCTTADTFKVKLHACQQEHPNASHHCYAFLLGDPNDSQKYGFSDDGEPSGTAGRPMLASLQGSEVGEVAAIVVRYFGGTKLGTGGLSRAYSLSVRNAVEKLQSRTKIPMVQRHLTCQYTQVNDVFYLLEQHQGKLAEQGFGEQVSLILNIPESNVDGFAMQLETMSSGKLVLTSKQE